MTGDTSYNDAEAGLAGIAAAGLAGVAVGLGSAELRTKGDGRI